ncbi:stromal membrane-associated protein 1-like isoform X2 [Oppia nitens]|uniref:stromal membrane-associated protein 1-like isoform X2 n=1 Tax=Oppia nitens TaxID=1686743 RepID=UPI0023DC366B|nr:stromal membrane-associated protein 1-like isoform X2 [Oppia nitens]
MAFNNKLERDKQKLVTEKCQQILGQLLRDEDNKYCVDCDAKGPRWTAWNLGIFLCIRCAGIHRNLGVHISRVKSVNLDAWTPEQIACIQNMGNSKARAVYEANLPDNFRRPTTDSTLEAFIRAKYEQKKYIAKEWVEPPPPKPAFDIEEELRKEKEKKRNKVKAFQSPMTTTELQANPLPRPNSTGVNNAINADKIVQKVENGKSSTDLLGLDISNSLTNKSDDESFGLFVSSADTKENNENKCDSKIKSNEESDFFNQKATGDEKKVMSKESILSLYASASPIATSLPQQQPNVGTQNASFNTSNALFMGQFVPNSQPMTTQIPNSLFMSQNNSVSPAVDGLQSSNLMNQMTQLPQQMSSLQMNPMTGVNPNMNAMANSSSNWFNMVPQNTGPSMPLTTTSINPFVSMPTSIPTGVPFANNLGTINTNSGSLFTQPDTGPQWAFNNNNTSLNQTSGVTASNNLWQ